LLHSTNVLTSSVPWNLDVGRTQLVERLSPPDPWCGDLRERAAVAFDTMARCGWQWVHREDEDRAHSPPKCTFMSRLAELSDKHAESAPRSICDVSGFSAWGGRTREESRSGRPADSRYMRMTPPMMARLPSATQSDVDSIRSLRNSSIQNRLRTGVIGRPSTARLRTIRLELAKRYTHLVMARPPRTVARHHAHRIAKSLPRSFKRAMPVRDRCHSEAARKDKLVSR